MREIYLSDYDINAVEYIFDKYSREKLFKMSDYDLKELVLEECNELSLANEELKYGTFGEHYENDIDFELVYEYIIKERDDYNATHKIRIS